MVWTRMRPTIKERERAKVKVRVRTILDEWLKINYYKLSRIKFGVDSVSSIHLSS